MLHLPLEILLEVLFYVDFPTIFNLLILPVLSSINSFKSFVDFSQLSGHRLLVVFGPFELQLKIVSRFKALVSSRWFDDELLTFMSFLLNDDYFKLIFKERKRHIPQSLHRKPGFCYMRIYGSEIEELPYKVMGGYPTVSDLRYFEAYFNIIRCHSERCQELMCHRLYRSSWNSMDINEGTVHLRSWLRGETLVFGSEFLSNSDLLETMVVGAPVKVSLTDCGASERMEDELMSLLGGSEEEIHDSQRKALDWRRREYSDFERSCECRFNHLEKSIEKILNIIESSEQFTGSKRTVLPDDSASRVGESKRLNRDSVVPIVGEVLQSDFSVTHPGWNPAQYENDLSLAMNCSGVVDGNVVGCPDPGAGGLVPVITVDSRLNFLIRLHTALFKLLSENSDYPGKDFLRKFKDLRDEKLKFDHPSLDLLEIVLEDTVDWRKHVVKRNLFKIPGFHPGLKLTERVIGSSLISMREEYRMRWNSLVGDCVLPGMLTDGLSRWSDDRRKVSGERDKTHVINTKRRTSDERSSHKSKTGWSLLSDLG